MKLFTSTTKTQGQRKSDFCFVPEDEIVVFSFICDTDAKSSDPDSGCGCGRSLAGAICQKGTTTFKVVDSPLSANDYIHLYLGAMQDAGLLFEGKRIHIGFRKDARELLRMATLFEVGDVVEVRKNKFQKRKT
jgi:hypothetical protein